MSAEDEDLHGHYGDTDPQVLARIIRIYNKKPYIVTNTGSDSPLFSSTFEPYLQKCLRTLKVALARVDIEELNAFLVDPDEEIRKIARNEYEKRRNETTP